VTNARPLPARLRRVAAAAAAMAYLVAAAALAVTAVMIWRAYCEGFGCIGKGIAWFAWAIAYALALGVGLVARYAYEGPGARWLRRGVMLQLAGGVLLLAVWALRGAW